MTFFQDNRLWYQNKTADNLISFTLSAHFKSMPLGTQHTLIAMVINGQREVFDTYLTHCGFSSDTNKRCMLWDEIVKQISCSEPEYVAFSGATECFCPTDDENVCRTNEGYCKTLQIVTNFVSQLKKDEKTKLALLVSCCDPEGFAEYLGTQFELGLTAEEQQFIWDAVAQTLPSSPRKAHKLQKEKSGAVDYRHSLELIPEEYEVPALEVGAVGENDNCEEEQSNANAETQKRCDSDRINDKKWYRRLIHRKKRSDAPNQKSRNGRKKKMNDRWSDHSTIARAAANNSIACEKSQTYVVELKPPSYSLSVNFAKQNSNDCQSCQRHEKQEKEDIFICV
ncbi:hypothetical protein RFI_24733 [Reticulomyxa filosa]|uniref:Uncharacterized protein n=1 Tax=Reticulomyxa filosa TaxID=46433 RepID=X6MG36_RETFI|nr:hypothetical protein RFI_24733 [Reticulomyxa filosa]|eukprot:ETO12646.1 hypothetical protein RFI_24733 [Reticulomyxa filosa]